MGGVTARLSLERSAAACLDERLVGFGALLGGLHRGLLLLLVVLLRHALLHHSYICLGEAFRALLAGGSGCPGYLALGPLKTSNASLPSARSSSDTIAIMIATKTITTMK